MSQITIDELRTVVGLQGLPDDQLQWIIDHSEYREYEDGELVAKYGEPADVMWIAVEGKVVFYMYVNGRFIYYFTFENNSTTGGIGGLLPYSRMKTFPGNSYAAGKVRGLLINKKWFTELERISPELIQRIVGYMTERARVFATTQSHHEKVNALGVLAAGIAHELNNPAAAINRIASELTRRLSSNYDLTKKMLQCDLTPEHVQHMQSLVERKEAEERKKLSSMQRIEIEDELEEWMEDHGVHDRAVAETFAEFQLTIEELKQVKSDLGDSNFKLALPWLENLLSSRKIITDLAEASNRISTLVASIKSHVHMDRTKDLQPTDLHVDIDNTITLLGFKLREKNIKVIKKYCSDLPQIPAYVGELNQVWTNLIDNAIFAMDREGQLTIETQCNSKEVTINIVDTGKGIDQKIINRIFDPFFTTKKVGEGTGIGLDIVNRIVKSHKGDIKVESEPGRTRFSVCIPVDQSHDSLYL